MNVVLVFIMILIVALIVFSIFAVASNKCKQCDEGVKITSAQDLDSKTMLVVFAFSEEAFTKLVSSHDIINQFLFSLANLQILSGLPVMPYITRVSPGDISSGVTAEVAIKIKDAKTPIKIIVGTDINTLGDDLENIYKKVRMVAGINTNLPENVDLGTIENLLAFGK
jgi:hypothetical protein